MKPVTVTQRNLLMPIIAAIVPLIVIAGVVTLYFAGGQKSPSAPHRPLLHRRLKSPNKPRQSRPK